MGSIKQIREGLAVAMRVIPDLNTYDIVPDQVSLPAAVVYGPEIDWDLVMGGGSAKYRFWVVLMVSRTEERVGQEQLDTFLATTGDTSIKTAIENNTDLKSVLDDVYVREVRDYQANTTNQGAPVFMAAVLVEAMT